MKEIQHLYQNREWIFFWGQIENEKGEKQYLIAEKMIVKMT